MLKIRRFLEYRICCSCGKEFIACQGLKINSKDYVCRECSYGKSYSYKNDIFKGKKTRISFSFEFETSSKNKNLFELLKYGFAGCYDGSISGLEWKSCIYYNKKSLHAICRKLDKFAKYVGNSCGTHLHVSTKHKQTIQIYRKEIFDPIMQIMQDNRSQTIRFWGRFFGHYCNPSHTQGRYNAFNTESSVETIEYRLLKFINSDQYIRACDFCIDTTRYINECIEKSKEFNQEKAEKIGKVIAEKYKEVIKNV